VFEIVFWFLTGVGGGFNPFEPLDQRWLDLEGLPEELLHVDLDQRVDLEPPANLDILQSQIIHILVVAQTMQFLVVFLSGHVFAAIFDLEIIIRVIAFVEVFVFYTNFVVVSGVFPIGYVFAHFTAQDQVLQLLGDVFLSE